MNCAKEHCALNQYRCLTGTTSNRKLYGEVVCDLCGYSIVFEGEYNDCTDFKECCKCNKIYCSADWVCDECNIPHNCASTTFNDK